MPAEVETKKAGEAKEEPQDETQDLKLKIEHEADEKVVVHPLVLLSVVDHYNRMRKVCYSEIETSSRKKPLRVPSSFHG